ncbi:hypothetical protein IJI17_01815 [Candidatus Saccharibacteria bacterium]|nr:hypothetical protein [Candidatus Saccharibacteria bacterium]
MQNNPQNTQVPNVPGFLSGSAGQDAGDGTPAERQEKERAEGRNGGQANDKSMMKEIVRRVKEAENVLVALTDNPSIDEIATAIGLTTALDAAGKYVTAIYSGETPNVLEFLKPEETFETNTDSLQDFIIALNKDKADHLRYKIDGDFVKVYITPYKTTIGEEDLEFSRGDFNVDLVIGLNVPAATELDSALKEHGRIMSDATAVNITNGAAGKFGDVEWVDEGASSVAEMVAELAFELNKEVDAATATALLTGIVSATDKFTNQATTPEAMLVAAKLMKAGADQQEVIQNISMELKFTARKEGDETEIGVKSEDGSSLSIKHEEEKVAEASVEQGRENEVSAEETSEKNESAGGTDAGLTGALAAQMGGGTEAELPKIETRPLDPVQAAMESAMGTANATEAAETSVSLADQMVAQMNGGATAGVGAEASGGMVGVEAGAPMMVGSALPSSMQGGALPASMQGGTMPASMMASEMPNSMMGGQMGEMPSGVPAGMTGAQTGGGALTGQIQSTVESEALGQTQGVAAGEALGQTQDVAAGEALAGSTQGVNLQPTGAPAAEQPATDYGKMIDAALAEPMPGEVGATGVAETAQGAPMGQDMGMANPAMMQAPDVEGMQAPADVPAMDYGAMPAEAQGVGTLPMPGQELTPPPMTPAPDFGAMPPVMSPSAPTMPSMPAVDPSVVQPGAYQIPGM